jgi:hypothetical protein
LVKEERNVKDDARKLYRTYQKAYREEQKLLFTSSKSMLTDEIARADREHNSLYMGLKKSTNARRHARRGDKTTKYLIVYLRRAKLVYIYARSFVLLVSTPIS